MDPNASFDTDGVKIYIYIHTHSDTWASKGLEMGVNKEK